MNNKKKILLDVLLCVLLSLPVASADILSVAERGNLEQLKSLLKESPELINIKDAQGYTLLHKAAYNNHSEVVKYLISAGAEISAPAGNGSTPLHGAATYGHLNIVEILLENGADISSRNSSGFTPLLGACAGGHIEIVSFLLSRGADIDVRTGNGWTPLIYAVNSRNAELCRMLIEKGCNVNHSAPDGISPLSRALWNADRDITELLISHNANVDAYTNDSLTQFYFAVAYREKALADLMIDKAGMFHIKNGYQMTMLHFAAARGFLDQVEKLIEKGVDVNALDINHRTALDYASLWAHDAVVNYLRGINALSNESRREGFKGKYLGQQPPSKQPQPFAENMLLTPFAPHGSIAFSPDGREVLWCHHAMPVQAMWYMKEIDGAWTKPQIAPFTNPASDYFDGSPSFSSDCNRIYYHSHRPTDTGENRNEDSDIWYVKRTGNGWGSPVNVGAPVNSNRNEYAPCIATDGSIYFIGDGYEDSYGTGDIYVCEFIEGKFTAPRNLGEKINSPQHELNPIIAPDDSYLIFSSNRPNPYNYQGLNLYVSLKDRGGAWTEAVLLGQSINTEGVWHPFITPDGKYVIYLKSDNYYWFSKDVIEDLKSVILQPDSIKNVPVHFVQSKQNFGSGQTRVVRLGDLDSDGDLDAVFSCGQVWLNDGHGQFTLKQDNMIYRGHGVDIGDIDGDKDIDIIFAAQHSRPYLNDGHANFTPSNDFLGDTSKFVFDLSLIDMDNNGTLDALVNYAGNTRCWYKNDGTGHFMLSDSTLPGRFCDDLDNDGDLDFFIREEGSGYKVLLNDGRGKLIENWTLSDSTTEGGFLEFADLDNDGDSDILVTNGGNDNIYPTLQLSNDGTGNFTIVRNDLPRTRWGNIAFGDLNNDGFLDALVTNFRLPNYIFLNDGKGILYDSGIRFGGNAGSMVSAVGDLDGDGDLDLFISNFFGGSCEVWFNEL